MVSEQSGRSKSVSRSSSPSHSHLQHPSSVNATIGTTDALSSDPPVPPSPPQTKQPYHGITTKRLHQLLEDRLQKQSVGSQPIFKQLFPLDPEQYITLPNLSGVDYQNQASYQRAGGEKKRERRGRRTLRPSVSRESQRDREREEERDRSRSVMGRTSGVGIGMGVVDIVVGREAVEVRH